MLRDKARGAIAFHMMANVMKVGPSGGRVIAGIGTIPVVGSVDPLAIVAIIVADPSGGPVIAGIGTIPVVGSADPLAIVTVTVAGPSGESVTVGTAIIQDDGTVTLRGTLNEK